MTAQILLGISINFRSSIYIYIVGAVKTEIFHFRGVLPPLEIEIFHLPKVKYFSSKILVYNGLWAWLNSRLNVMFWRLFGKFTLFYNTHKPVCKYVCAPPQKTIYIYIIHICLKCGIRRTPPRLLETQKNTWVGVYFTSSGELFLRNFMPYPPPKKSRVKGGGYIYI